MLVILIQELRVLKNFSSLKAIISALQSNPIYRLKHVWANVPKDKVEVYEELARIFSEENNQSAQRELLMKEGTAKFAETAGENDRQMQKVIQKQASHSNVSFPFYFILIKKTKQTIFLLLCDAHTLARKRFNHKKKCRFFLICFQNNSL